MKANTRGADQRRMQEGGRGAGQKAEVRAAFEGPGGPSEPLEVREMTVGPQGKKTDNGDMEDMKKMVEKLCTAVSALCSSGLTKAAEPGNNGAGAAQRRSGGCFICHDTGHWASQCPLKGQGGNQGGMAARAARGPEAGAPLNAGPWGHQGAYAARNENPNGTDPKRCFRCREVGHLARECPNRQSDEAREREGPQGVRIGTMVCGFAGEQPVYLTLTFGRYRLKCLLDTGCQKSILPSRIVQGMGLGPVIDELYAANGTRIATQGTAEVPLRLGGLYLPVEAIITEHVREPMLGMDWMLANECKLDFKDLTVTLQGKVFPLEKRATGLNLCRRVVVARRVEIPAWSQSYHSWMGRWSWDL